jgi:peptidoglycan-associated lipoprotein
MRRSVRTPWPVFAVALAASFAAAACRGAPPPPPPEPAVDTAAERRAREEAEARRRAEEEARRRAEEERRRREERERVLAIIAERVHFDFDKSNIRPDQEPVLQRKIEVLRQYPGIKLQIEGHCDERGSNEYNLALGQRRAESVKRYLTSYGLSPDRFTTISYGEERPLDPGHNEAAWAKNRRTEFVVIDYGQLGAGD